MGKRLLLLGCTVVMASAGGAALADQPAPGRGAIEIGARLGYGIPFGSEGRSLSPRNDRKVGDDTSGIIPIWLDAGYRFGPHLYVGLFLQYAFGFVNTDINTGCTQPGMSCSSSDARLGVNVHYHFAPGRAFEPWLGLGVGYEWLTLSGNNSSLTMSGFEFANIQLGGDFRAAPRFGVGPFVSFSLGQYSTTTANSDGRHEWLVVGVRGVFDNWH